MHRQLQHRTKTILIVLYRLSETANTVSKIVSVAMNGDDKIENKTKRAKLAQISLSTIKLIKGGKILS